MAIKPITLRNVREIFRISAKGRFCVNGHYIMDLPGFVPQTFQKLKAQKSLIKDFARGIISGNTCTCFKNFSRATSS